MDPQEIIIYTTKLQWTKHNLLYKQIYKEVFERERERAQLEHEKGIEEYAY